MTKVPKPASNPPLSREQAMARRAAADFAAMDRANSKPIDLALLEAEPWTGGGFTWNGQPVGRSRS
jgi:hypothetical protein